MPETTNGLPYPPGTGVLPDVPYWLQQLAEFLDPLVVVEDATGQAPTSGQGWAGGTVDVRRIGPMVTVDVSVTLGTASNAGAILLQGLPSPRGGAGIWRTLFINANGAVAAGVQVDNGGQARAYWTSGPGPANVLRGGFAYFTDELPVLGA